MRRRIRIVTSCLFAVALAAAMMPSPTVAQTAPGAQGAQVCKTLGEELLIRTWRGWSPDRGGDIMAIPREPNFVGGGLPHAGPWDYLQEVPLLFWGPDYIKDRGSVAKPASLADIAPTTGAILGYDFPAPDGRVLNEALLKKTTEGNNPPKLIVTLVWDAGGRDVLDRWPNAWPNLKKLIDEGTWFDNAEVGASPSDTPPSHGTIGTGSFPTHHGLLDQVNRIGPEMRTPWGAGPTTMLEPSLADLYDLSMDNKPIVGAIASLGAHLGMIGHGSMWGGGDKDIAVNRENTGDEGDEGTIWNLRSTISPYFTFPKYVSKTPPLSKFNKLLDQEDGAADGKWMGHTFAELRGGFDTPARIPYQTAVIKKVITKEGFGQDDVPDLLYLNYKIIDNMGHKFSADSREMEDTVKHQDAELKLLMSFLNKKVGDGNWVLVMTADHGSQRDPNVTGAYNASPGAMEDALNATFNQDSDNVSPFLAIRPTQMWLNDKELKQNGFTTQDVVDYLAGLSETDVPSGGQAPSSEKLFASVFPSSILPKLPCIRAEVRRESVPGWNQSADDEASSETGGTPASAGHAP